MNAVTETVAAEPVSGVEIFVPLAKLKKSPRNARKVPHGEAAIEALAASIQHKGLIQNLVIEPEVREDGTQTGYYLVTAGEGRRLAMLLRAKRKQIKKSEPVRCWLDTANDPSEISLDENVTRTPMHPADQFERFAELSNNKGWGAQEIGARFGVSAAVVKQRLRLGAVSPKLLQVYREDGLTLDQLMAFAITEDHARQEQVFEGLHHNREPWIIRRDMTAANVPAADRRAVFVGADAYIEAGGNIIRDLFSEDRGGFFEDAGLLDMLVARAGAPRPRIVDFSDDLAAAFRDINAEWIEAMFTLEANDRAIFDHPRAAIVDRGGVIRFVSAAGLGVVGTCALIRIADGVFELTKMGVLAAARGRKAGEFLLAHVVAEAWAMRLDRLCLLTNSRCAA